MDLGEHERRVAYEAELARRIRDAVVTEVPRRPVRSWLLAGAALLAAAALLVTLVLALAP